MNTSSHRSPLQVSQTPQSSQPLPATPGSAVSPKAAVGPAPSATPNSAPTATAAADTGHMPPASPTEQQALQALAEKGFIHDAAHQLRTPLAGIISQAELALKENDPQQLHQRIRKMHAAAQRGAQLVKQMLALARSEATEPSHIATEPYDIAQLAREVAREWIPKSLALRKDLGYEGADNAWVRGNRFMMREAIGNLIDNALNYTAANGHVTVRVQVCAAAQHASAPSLAPADPSALALGPQLGQQTATASHAHPAHSQNQSTSGTHHDSHANCSCPPSQRAASPSVVSTSSASSTYSAEPVAPRPSSGPTQTQPSGHVNSSTCNDKPSHHTPDLDTVILEVIDNGPGVAPEQLACVFERFWRANDEHSSGSGLGLPLVERIAAQHGGNASAHNAQPQGFIVRLRLPAAKHPGKGKDAGGHFTTATTAA